MKILISYLFWSLPQPYKLVASKLFLLVYDSKYSEIFHNYKELLSQGD